MRDIILSPQFRAEKIRAHEHCVEMPYGKLCKPLANICIKHAVVYYLLHTKHKMATNRTPQHQREATNYLPEHLQMAKRDPPVLLVASSLKNVAALSHCFLSVVNKRRLDGKGDEPSPCLGRIWSRSGSQDTLLLGQPPHNR